MGALVWVMPLVLVDGVGLGAQRVRGGIGARREGLPTVSPFACGGLAVACDHTTDPTFFSTVSVCMWFWLGLLLVCARAFLGYAKFVCGERGAPAPVAHANLYEELLLR